MSASPVTQLAASLPGEPGESGEQEKPGTAGPNDSSSVSGFLENPELVRLLTDINQTLVFVKDRQGRFVFANKAFADIYTTSVESLLGKTDADFNPNTGEIEQYLEHDLQVMDSLEDSFIPEERVTSPAGQSVWLQTVKRPLVESDGVCNHILGVGIDITKRVLAELKGKELQVQLHHYERLESLGTMAGGIAHDLNNILGPLVGYPSLIREETQNAKIRSYLDEMERSSERAVALISDLLSMARRGDYQATPVGLGKCIEDFIRSAATNNLKSNHPDIKFELKLGEGLPSILGSEAHLHRVLMNLTRNAFEAIEGAGTVSISTRVEENNQPVDGFDQVPGVRCAVIEITDTGAGISEASRPRIFDPFFSTKQSSSGGTGLGLAVVYGIIKDMSGSISVSSAPGVGSTFTVRLPMAENSLDGLAESVWNYRGDEHILVIDDLPSQRQLAHRLLGALGYKVQTAESGAEALRLCAAAKEPFSLVIIDMVLGDGPNGVDVYRNLQRHFPDLPCIIVSGYSETERVKEGLAAGVAAFVSKPYTQAVLGAEVRNTLNRPAATS